MSPHVTESFAPTRSDPVAASASEIIGGPLGRHAVSAAGRAARSAWQPAATVLVGLSSLTVALGFLQKAHCFTKGWANPDQFWHACYSDLPASSGLGHAMPYLSGAPHLDQPLVSGVAMWLVGLAVPDGSAAQQQWYFALWAVLIAVIVMALVVVTAASVPRAPWRAAQVALSPVLVLAGLISADLVGVLLASVALLAWGRNKIYLAGLFMGLAISARSYPLVLLVAIGLLCVRSGRVSAWAKLAGTTLVTCLVVGVPFLVISADGLLSAYRAWWRAGPSYGSLWLVPGLLGHGLESRVMILVLLGWLAALVAGAMFALSMDRRPTVAELSLVMLVIVVVTGKATPVQAGLWLIPLIALVGLKWRDYLIWAGVEATYFLAVWLYIAGISKPDRGLPRGFYIAAVLLRALAWLYVLVQVWRSAAARPPVLYRESEERESEQQRSEQQRSGDQNRGELESGGQVSDELESVGQASDELVSDERGQDEEVDSLAGPMAGAPDLVIVRVS